MVSSFRQYLDTQVQTNMALSSSPFYTTNVPPLTTSQSCRDFSSTQLGLQQLQESATKVVLDQSDLYSNLFVPLVEASGPGQSSSKIQRLVSVILEYSRSLEEQRIPVQHFLNEVLIHLLVRNESWYQLHQLLQYRVISDSKVRTQNWGRLIYTFKVTFFVPELLFVKSCFQWFQ